MFEIQMLIEVKFKFNCQHSWIEVSYICQIII